MSKILKSTVDELVDRYVIEVAWAPEDKAFVATVEEFPRLVARSDECPGEAVRLMHSALWDAVEILKHRKQTLPAVSRESLHSRRARASDVRGYLAKLERFILADIRKDTPVYDWEDELTGAHVCDADSTAAADLELSGSSDESIVIAKVSADGDDAVDDPEYRIKARLGKSRPGWGVEHDTEWSKVLLLTEVPFYSIDAVKKALNAEIVSELEALES